MADCWIPTCEHMPPVNPKFPNELCSAEVLFILVASNGCRVRCLGYWDGEREAWVDTETDADGDRLEWPPGEVSHWCELPEVG